MPFLSLTARGLEAVERQPLFNARSVYRSRRQALEGRGVALLVWDLGLTRRYLLR